MRRVPAAELTSEDLGLIWEATQRGPAYEAIPLQQVVRELWSEELQLFRLKGGVMLTEIVTGYDGSKRLNVVAMAGNKLAQQFQAISRDLQHAAREFGCNAIECDVYSDKLARALRRGGAKQASVVMVLELDNG